MKKSVVLASIAIIVVGMVAGFEFIISEETSGKNAIMEKGEKLHEMEQESSRRVKSLIEEIKAGRLSQSDCQVELNVAMKSILDNLAQLRDGKGNYINVAYNCEIFRKLSGLMEDKKNYEEAEEKLRKDNLSIFSNRVFAYCIDVGEKRQEEADYLKLSDWAEDIEANLDQEVERYTKRVYAWYGSK